MRHYNINTFLDEEPQTKEDVIDQKIGLLYDFGKLHRGRYNAEDDERESLVRKMLNAEDSETAMTRILHDVLMGRISLNTLLKQKGFEQ